MNAFLSSSWMLLPRADHWRKLSFMAILSLGSLTGLCTAIPFCRALATSSLIIAHASETLISSVLVGYAFADKRVWPSDIGHLPLRCRFCFRSNHAPCFLERHGTGAVSQFILNRIFGIMDHSHDRLAKSQAVDFLAGKNVNIEKIKAG